MLNITLIDIKNMFQIKPNIKTTTIVILTPAKFYSSSLVGLIVISFYSSFAQWRYHSRWGLTEAWLLLVENYSQYPALTTLVVGKRNF